MECDGRDVAYQVTGAGSRGLVIVLEVAAHLDLIWTDSAWSNMFERFDPLARIAMFQMRGIGLSEPVERRPTAEEQAHDIERVMDAAGIDRAIVEGAASTAAGSVVFAATHPERVEALVLVEPLLSGVLAEMPDLTGWEAGEARAYAALWHRAADNWGSGAHMDAWDPVIASPRTYRQVGLLERTAASRPVARAYIESLLRTDVSRVAGQVQAPVRVLHAPTNPIPEAVMRHAAQLFPNGEFQWLPPSQAGMSWGESFVAIGHHFAEMITGQSIDGTDRVLATLMFEDVVGSTTLVAHIGDQAWRELMVNRDRTVADLVDDHDGRVVSTAGDGSMLFLPGADAALQCAQRLHQAMRELDLEVRIGIHTGECERVGNDLAGLAVHVAARIGAAAEPGQTLASRATADMVAGSEWRLESRGQQELKGIPGTWELLAVRPMTAQTADIPAAPAPRLGDRAIIAAARRAPRFIGVISRLGIVRGRRSGRSSRSS